jgi:hypothetical protein
VRAALVASLVCSLVAVASACGGPSPDAEARLEAVHAEAAALDAALDGVEDRLLGNEMRLHLWQELGERHRHVSEVTCRTNSQHIQSVVRHFEKTEEVFRRKRGGSKVATPVRGQLPRGVGGP